MNKVILIGTVGKDPEVKELQSGSKVANFSIATNKRYKNKQGEKVEETEWHNIVIWGNLTSVVDRFVKKGTKLSVSGEIKTEKWDKDGVTQYKVNIVCNELELLGSKNKSEDDDMPF